MEVNKKSKSMFPILVPICIPILWPLLPLSIITIVDLNKQDFKNKIEIKCRNLNGVPVYYDRKVMTCINSKTGIPIDIKDN